MNRLFGILFIAISAASFGAMPIFAKYAYLDGVSPNTLLFLRFSIAACCMLIYIAVRRLVFPKGTLLFALFLMGAIGYGGQSYTYFTALKYAPTGLVALLLYLYPALVVILSVFFLKHKLTIIEVLALFLALTGTVLVLGVKTSAQMLGIVLGIMAACIYSIYIIVGTRLMKKAEIASASTIIMIAAGLFFSILSFIEGFEFPKTSNGWMHALAISLISTVVAILCFFEGLKRIGPVSASMISTIEPVVTVVLAFIFLGEPTTIYTIIGGMLILSTALLLARKKPETVPQK